MKTFCFILGVLIILSVSSTVVLLTFFDVVELLLFMLDSNYNKDLLAFGIFTLPMLVFSWFSWCSDWNIKNLRNLLTN